MLEIPSHIQNVLHSAAVDEGLGANRRSLWVTVLGLTPRRDGNQWCFLWGENLQEGVSGFGCTPEDAACAFDSAMGQCGGTSTVPKR